MSAQHTGRTLLDLDHALATTRSMLEAARADDWESVMELERARSGRLARCALSAESPAAAPGLRPRLGEILALNEQIRGLASARRDDLAQRTRNARAGRRASRAYRNLSP